MSPTTALLATLAASRRRGARFEDVWPGAVKAAVATTDTDRAGWRTALEATRDEWGAAFDRQPSVLAPRPLGALTLVASGRQPEAPRMPACPVCQEPVSGASGGRPRMYCSDRCRRDAYEARRRAA